jgi:Helicase associated domain
MTLYSSQTKQARWVKRQRYQYKLFIEGKSGSTMTELRKNLLQDLGFCWDRHSEAWEIRYSELCKFLEENGHTNVPSNHQNTQLATWVKCQRRQYKMRWEEGSVNKKTLLSDERIERLEALGFEWELRSRSKLTSAEPFG